jgi:hypothetical protein
MEDSRTKSVRLAIAITLAVCVIGVIATVTSFWLAGRNGYGGWHLIAVLASFPYVWLAVASVPLSRRFAAALVILVGSISITAFGSVVLAPLLRPAIVESVGPINCAGPILELLLPCVQAVAVCVLCVVALSINWWEGAKTAMSGG